MITVTRQRYGYHRCDNVEACVTVGGEELVAVGSVILNAIGESSDVWIDVIRREDGTAFPLDRLTTKDEDDVHDALVLAAREHGR